MVPFNDTSEMHHSAKASQPESTRHEGMLPFRARQVPMMSSLFRGMVVSSEDSVRRRLAELLRQCGLTPVLASTVADSQATLAKNKVCMLLCDECLADGDYQAVVEIVKHADTKPPSLSFRELVTGRNTWRRSAPGRTTTWHIRRFPRR